MATTTVAPARVTAPETARETFQSLCLARSTLGGRLAASGRRPIDDPTFRAMASDIAAAKRAMAHGPRVMLGRHR